MFAPQRWLLPLLWLLILGAGLFRLALFRHEQIYALTFTRMDGLSAGAVLAVYFRRGPLARYRSWLMAGFVVFTGLSAVLAVGFGREQLLWFAVVKYWAISGMYALLLAVILITPNWGSWKLLRSTPVRWVGRVSYGLYVFHPIVFAYVFHATAAQPVLVRCAAGFSATGCVAAASWYFFERQFLRWKDRFSPERRAVPEAPITVRESSAEAVF